MSLQVLVERTYCRRPLPSAVMELEVHVLSDAPDPRGSSFSIPESRLPPDFVVRDAHVMTVQPGTVRGDHFHCAKREVFLVTYLDNWSLHWDGGSRRVHGQGCAAILVPPLLSHAIRNSGRAPLHVVALSDAPYDPAQPDSHHRKVSSP